MTDEVEGGWDDPEELEPVETLTTTGDGWTWVPPWSRQNPFGADRELWKGTRPPVTQRLAERLHPYEVAHFEDSTFRQRLLDFTARTMLKRRVEGVEPEDLLQDVLIEMERVRERERFVVGSRDYMRVAQVVIRRRVTDVLRRMGGQKDRGSRLERRESLMYGEYIAKRKSRPFEATDPEDDAVDQDPLTNLEAGGLVPQVFSADFSEALSAILTPRELEAVTLTYEQDLTNAQTAEKMDCSENAVAILLTRARTNLMKGFANYSR